MVCGLNLTIEIQIKKTTNRMTGGFLLLFHLNFPDLLTFTNGL
jgi:hypothetical protein